MKVRYWWAGDDRSQVVLLQRGPPFQPVREKIFQQIRFHVRPADGTKAGLCSTAEDDVLPHPSQITVAS